MGGFPFGVFPANEYLKMYLDMMGLHTTGQTPEELMQTPGFNPNAPIPKAGDRQGIQIGGVTLPPGQHPPFPTPTPAQPPPMPPSYGMPDVPPGPNLPAVTPTSPVQAPIVSPQAAGTGVFSRMSRGLQDPRFRAFTLNMANRLLQTPQVGETGMQTWGQSLLQGYQGLNALSLLQQAAAQQAREERRKQEAHDVDVEYKRGQTTAQREETGIRKGQLDINRDTAKWDREYKMGTLDLNKDELAQRRIEHIDKVRQSERQLDIEQGKLDELIANNADEFKIKAQKNAVDTATANAQIYKMYAEAYELKHRHLATGRTDQLDLERFRRVAQIAAQVVARAEPGATQEQNLERIRSLTAEMERITGIPFSSPTGGARTPAQAAPGAGAGEPPPGAMLPRTDIAPTERPVPASGKKIVYPGEMPFKLSGLDPSLYGPADVNAQTGQWEFPPVPGMTPKYPDQIPPVPTGGPGTPVVKDASPEPGEQTLQTRKELPAAYGSTAPEMMRRMGAGQKTVLANNPNKYAWEQYPPVELMAPDGTIGTLRNVPPEKVSKLIREKGYQRTKPIQELYNPGLPTSIVP